MARVQVKLRHLRNLEYILLVENRTVDLTVVWEKEESGVRHDDLKGTSSPCWKNTRLQLRKEEGNGTRLENTLCENQKLRKEKSLKESVLGSTDSRGQEEVGGNRRRKGVYAVVLTIRFADL